MNHLKEILTKLADKEAEASIDPEDTNPNVRAGVEALVRNAKADLSLIKSEYKNAVMDNVVVLSVLGEGSKQFADYASKLGAVSINFEAVTERLVTNLRNRAVGDLYTSTAHFMLLDELSKLRLEYDIVRLPTPQINAYNDGIYDAPLAHAISLLLDKNYGTSLQSAITKREIGNAALEAKFSGQKLPVVIYNMKKQSDSNFIPNPFTIIEVDGKVTEELVKNKLKDVKTKLKKTGLTGADATGDEA